MQNSVAEAVPCGRKARPPRSGLRDVTIAFRLGGGVTYTAVEKASLSVADGEFVAIVGSDRLRQVDAAQCRRRTAFAVARARRRFSARSSPI